MRYLRVEWLGAGPDEPTLLFSELDDQGFEIRKVEIFPDGHIGHAIAGQEVGGTRLGDQPVPSIDEIAADTQFRPAWISAEEFETVWRKRWESPAKHAV